VSDRAQHTSANVLRPPVSLGRHQLLFPVGHGGMSDVYLALVSSAAGVNKLLVVKQLRASLLDEPEALSMFIDEARLAARMHHPNVVQTFEVGQEGPLPYMTMEFLDGQPLHRVLRRLGVGAETDDAGEPRHPPLTLGMRLRIITEMLEGLHYAHELRDYDGRPMQVVHRDVSPQNLFITYDGQIKLVDFGIAKASDSVTRTEGRGLKGKLAYMSPQQAEGEALDRRADLFAAGVMLWEMLAGRRLWQGCSEATLARRLVAHDLPELGLEGVPARVLELCRKALAPALDDRYASADAFRHDLELFMADEGFDASPRAIGKRMAAAFAEEREQVRARIDGELRRQAEGGSFADSPGSLWSETYRGEATEGTLESNEREDSAGPDEDTADYGPQLLDEKPVPAPEREPPREASGVIDSGGALSEVPEASQDSAAGSRRSAWLMFVGGALGLGLLALGLQALREDSAPDEAAHEDEESPAGTRHASEPPLLPATTNGSCDTPPELRPRVSLSGEIDEDATLHCDRNYVLTFNTHVASGVTLTIEPGTVLLGDRETKGALIIEPGARLIAEGTRERPIVFTSSRPPSERAPGDWGGLVLLGRAPINLRDAKGEPMLGEVEGLTEVERYGGDDPEDNSGVLRYLRIEYPGVELAPGNELNGLTLAGVGRGTIIDHVQVRASSDDCFEFFGGTVDATHLVCDAPGDDAFDFDHGYQGRLQFVVVRDHAIPGLDKPSHAFELDNDPNGTLAEPRTRPVIWNASLCGLPGGRSPSYAILARRAAQPELGGLLVTGFDYALDRRDAETRVELRGLALAEQPGAEVEGVEAGADDDAGFDELAWLAEPARARVELTATEATIDCGTPASMIPKAAIVPSGGYTGAPDDGFFDPEAAWLGAFAGPDDDWTKTWVVWTDVSILGELGP
jgi:serine/threonine protein kinase